MSKSIPLSPKHGVNPMIPTCFFCGQEKNMIAFMGKLPGDAEAPKYGWLYGDYEPCDECQAKWKQGVVLIEANTVPNFDNQPPIQKNTYPTSRYIVIKEGGLSIFTDSVADELREKRLAFMTPEVFQQLRDFVGDHKEEK
jgi:hypothetical protein